MRSALDDAAFQRIAQALEQDEDTANEIELVEFQKDVNGSYNNVAYFSDGVVAVDVFGAYGAGSDGVLSKAFDSSFQEVDPIPYFYIEKAYRANKEYKERFKDELDENSQALIEYVKTTYLEDEQQQEGINNTERGGLVPGVHF